MYLQYRKCDIDIRLQTVTNIYELENHKWGYNFQKTCSTILLKGIFYKRTNSFPSENPNLLVGHPPPPFLPQKGGMFVMGFFWPASLFKAIITEWNVCNELEENRFKIATSTVQNHWNRDSEYFETYSTREKMSATNY